MMECVRLIIGGDGEREGERGKRSVDRLIQNNLGGREGTAMLGTKRGRSRRLPTPTLGIQLETVLSQGSGNLEDTSGSCIIV